MLIIFTWQICRLVLKALVWRWINAYKHAIVKGFVRFAPVLHCCYFGLLKLLITDYNLKTKAMMPLKKLFGTTACAVFLLLLLQTNISCKRIPKEGGKNIDYATADKLIKGFQTEPEKTKYPYTSIVSIDTIKKLLASAPNLRIYFGEDPRNRSVNLVLVAADDDGMDLKNGRCILITKTSVTSVTMDAASRYTLQFQQNAKQYAHFPYAEKFNTSIIKASLMALADIKNLRIELGKDVDGNMGEKGKIRMILFAARADSSIISYNPTTTGKTKSANPTYHMANYIYFEPQAVENGQDCLDNCIPGSSRLYR